MNILITGGSGFIGSHLSEKLLINAENKLFLLDNLLTGSAKNIEHLDKDKVVLIEHDVQDHIEIDEQIDYVFHFAGIAPLPDCQSNPYDAIDTNVAGTVNILDAARFNGVKRVIFSSTSAIYENNTNFPCTEDDEVSPYLVYSSSKLQSEMLCKTYAKTYGLDVVMLRFFNVYGPHQDVMRKQPPY